MAYGEGMIKGVRRENVKRPWREKGQSDGLLLIL